MQVELKEYILIFFVAPEIWIKELTVCLLEHQHKIPTADFPLK